MTPSEQPDHDAEGVEHYAPQGESHTRAPSDRVLVQLRARAEALGAARLGVADAEHPEHGRQVFERWLAKGYHGNMRYLEQPRRSPTELLPGAKSVLVAAFSYGARRSRRDATAVAAYAEGKDYHFVLKQQMRQLGQACADLLGRPVRARVCVDTAPLLERDWAAYAGVGFTGKSTLSIVPGVGSAVLLAELVIDQVLPPSAPIADGCGQCTRCLDACPTGAFVDAYTLDARRCISYLTIESPAPIPVELRRPIGLRIFGCDECQRVCPFNTSRKLPERADALEAPFEQPDPAWILELGSSAYRRWVAGSARRRTSRAQLQRNAAVALGNRGSPQDVPVLCRALGQSGYPLVRGHVAWALGQIGGEAARSALATQLELEPDPWAKDEICAALKQLGP